MRFPPELTDSANTGLNTARDLLEPVKSKFPWISYADLWILAGLVAIEEMDGPKIPFKPGRTDCGPNDLALIPPNGRLPLGFKDSQHIREIFSRLEMNDQEIVALLGAHGLGRTHAKYSGWDGKWTSNPIKFDNEFYKILLNDNWVFGKVESTGKKQYFNEKNPELMMLPTDLELVKDSSFKKWVEVYANDQDKFFEDFSNAFFKLTELGVERNECGFAPKI
ncbi:heme peroxidase, partial [Ascoidea rubescens DSM 1968]